MPGWQWHGQLGHAVRPAGATVAILDLNDEGMVATASGFTNVHRFSVDITDAQAVERPSQILKCDWVLSSVLPMRLRSCPLVVW